MVIELCIRCAPAPGVNKKKLLGEVEKNVGKLRIPAWFPHFASTIPAVRPPLPLFFFGNGDKRNFPAKARRIWLVFGHCWMYWGCWVGDGLFCFGDGGWIGVITFSPLYILLTFVNFPHSYSNLITRFCYSETLCWYLVFHACALWIKHSIFNLALVNICSFLEMPVFLNIYLQFCFKLRFYQSIINPFFNHNFNFQHHSVIYLT